MAEEYTGDEGDKALAAGIDIMDGTEDWRDGWRAINKSRDITVEQVDAERLARMAADDTKVTKPADGALMARREPGSAHSIGFYTTPDSTLYFRPDPATAVFDRRVAMYSELPTIPPDVVRNGESPFFNNLAVNGGLLNPGMTNVVSSYTAVYRQTGDGRLGTLPSALKYKHSVESYDGSALGLRPVTYILNEDEKQTVRVGIVADEANEVEPMLVVHEDGEVESFKYELLAVALLRDVQREHEARLAAEEQLSELASRVADLAAQVEKLRTGR